MAAHLRAATRADLPAITAIYNDAVLHTTATFDTRPRTEGEQAAWLARHGAGHPVLVATEAGEVVGWACLSPWSDRPAYEATAEDSVYVRADRRGAGVGRALLAGALDAGRAAGLHTVLARIAMPNPASVALHRGAGFRTVGVMRQVGRKFGRVIDVELMQVMLGSPARAPEAP